MTPMKLVVLGAVLAGVGTALMKYGVHWGDMQNRNQDSVWTEADKSLISDPVTNADKP